RDDHVDAVRRDWQVACVATPDRHPLSRIHRPRQRLSHAGQPTPRGAGEVERWCRMTLLDRYRDGQCVAVWHELTSLGDDVRSLAHADDAYAVAFETMR